MCEHRINKTLDKIKILWYCIDIAKKKGDKNMSKPGANKKKYDKYKSSGTREKNKKLKAERHEKRMAKFARRKEEGKSYEYDAEKAKQKLIDRGYAPDSKYFKDNKEWILWKEFSNDTKDNMSKLKSHMKKCDNLLKKREADAKAKERTKKR